VGWGLRNPYLGLPLGGWALRANPPIVQKEKPVYNKTRELIRPALPNWINYSWVEFLRREWIAERRPTCPTCCRGNLNWKVSGADEGAAAVIGRESWAILKERRRWAFGLSNHVHTRQDSFQQNDNICCRTCPTSREEDGSFKSTFFLILLNSISQIINN